MTTTTPSPVRPPAAAGMPVQPEHPTREQALTWLVGTYLPHLLRRAGMDAHAARLAAMGPITYGNRAAASQAISAALHALTDGNPAVAWERSCDDAAWLVTATTAATARGVGRATACRGTYERNAVGTALQVQACAAAALRTAQVTA